MKAIDRLAALVARHDRQLKDLNRSNDLGKSSMEGSIGQYDPLTGQLLARYGSQWDGANGAVVMSGPVPPTPTAPELASVIGGVSVRVDGTFAGGPSVVAPSDFKGFEIQVSDDPSFPQADTPLEFELVHGPLITNARGGDVFVPWSPSGTPLYARVVTRAHSGKFSTPSEITGPIASGAVGLADLGFDIADYAGGTKIHYGAAEPAAADISGIGDLWLKEISVGPPPRYETWRWNGAAWQLLVDQNATAALAAAVAAQSAADSKARIFTQSTKPAWTGPNGSAIWFNTSDGNRQQVWDGTDFVDRRLGTGAFEPNAIVASSVFATGTITAALFEAIMVLTNVILTASPTGPHLRLDNQGLRSFALNSDGQLVATSQFGGPGADRWLITDPTTGAALASVDETGFLSVSGASINGPLYVRGNTLDYLLDQTPRGEIARAGENSIAPTTTTAVGFYDVEFLAIPGRSYRISTTSLQLNPSLANSYVYAALATRASSAGAPSLANSYAIVGGRGTAGLAGGVVPITLSRNCSFDELFPSAMPQVPTRVRVLLVYGVISGGGNVGIYGTDSYPIHTYVEDVGVSKPFTGVPNSGGGTTATPVTESTLDFATTYCRSYNGSNSGERSTSEMVQGYTSYYPAAGSAVSLMGFQDLTGILSGATIHWAALYMNSTWWDYDSGGEVMLGAHGYLNDTGSVKPGSGLFTDQLRDPGWQKPGGKWIYLPSSWFAGLASGATRGFTLGNGADTDRIHYGKFVSAGNGRPVLRINFSK